MSAFLEYELDGTVQRTDCGDLVTLGRHKSNSVALPDQKISRSHALLQRLGDGKYYLMDTGSSNGTYINQKRVLIPQVLLDGDLIRIGRHALTFHTEEEPPTVCLDGMGDDDEQPTIYTISCVPQKVTILVADIRGYTLMSEKIPVGEMAHIIGQWFRVANETVVQNGGVVDKFIGDAVMACWHTDTPERSVTAALHTAGRLLEQAQSIRFTLAEEPRTLKIGVGINTGDALMGNMGACSRRDYTVVGDAVNMAFHLESATKVLGVDLVLGPDACQYMPEPLWHDALQPVQVKGREQPLSVWAMNTDDVMRVLSTLPKPPQTAGL